MHVPNSSAGSDMTAGMAKDLLQGTFNALLRDLREYQQDRENLSFWQSFCYNTTLTQLRVGECARLINRLTNAVFTSQIQNSRNPQSIGSDYCYNACAEILEKLHITQEGNAALTERYQESSGDLNDILFRHQPVIRELADIFESHTREKSPAAEARSHAQAATDMVKGFWKKVWRASSKA